MDSPCPGSFPARRRGLGRNAGGFQTGGFRKFGGFKMRFRFLAEAGGFEPPMLFPAYRISSAAHSTALARLLAIAMV